MKKKITPPINVLLKSFLGLRKTGLLVALTAASASLLYFSSCNSREEIEPQKTEKARKHYVKTSLQKNAGCETPWPTDNYLEILVPSGASTTNEEDVVIYAEYADLSPYEVNASGYVYYAVNETEHKILAMAIDQSLADGLDELDGPRDWYNAIEGEGGVTDFANEWELNPSIECTSPEVQPRKACSQSSWFRRNILGTCYTSTRPYNYLTDDPIHVGECVYYGNRYNTVDWGPCL